MMRNGGLRGAARTAASRQGIMTLLGAVLALGGIGSGSANALTITPTFDSTWSSAPAGTLTQAMQAFTYVDDLYASAFGNPVNVNIAVSWGSVNGTALNPNDLGATSVVYGSASYSAIKTLLGNHAAANPNNAALATAVQHLPASVSGSFILPTAQYEALTGIDVAGIAAYVGFGSGTNWQFSEAGGIASNAYDFIAVVEHEVAHALGRVSYEFVNPVPYLTPMDLYRYNCGTTTLNHTYNTLACFSIDGGATDLQTFSNSSDSADWYGPSGTGTDAYDAYLNHGIAASVTPVDYTLMNALGYDPVPEPSSVLIFGAGVVSLAAVRRRRHPGARR